MFCSGLVLPYDFFRWAELTSEDGLFHVMRFSCVFFSSHNIAGYRYRV